ncbi:MAG: AAA family ATPase [Gracilimonas sp.]
MKLYRAKIKGFKRLSNVDITLNGKIIAIIGPNEAGKSSFLEALEHVENNNPIPEKSLSRNSQINPKDKVIELKFKVSKSEKIRISEFGGIGEPNWYIIEKSADGNISRRVYPEIERDLGKRNELKDKISKALNYNLVKRSFNYVYTIQKKNESNKLVEVKKSVKEYLKDVISILNSDMQNLNNNDLSYIGNIIRVLNEVISKISDKRKVNYLDELVDSIIEQKKYESEQNPEIKAIEFLEKERPRILSFSEKDRNLSSEYDIKVLRNQLPKPLQNLFDLAEIKSSELQKCIQQSDHAKRQEIQEQANIILKRKFTESWGQSIVYPKLELASDVIRVYVGEPKSYTEIAERSDGMKAFVALFAYLSKKSLSKPPLVLVDEAEMHLHYDAQADLIRMFENQKEAGKIIYTTHSAGCLPSDLGTGIRVISPIFDENEIDTKESKVFQSFWNSAPGFSSLLFAMGASLLSFVPTRRAVIGEGPTEMILLPTLLRQATETENLRFQVAPGLSRVANSDIKDLDLEAPRVAYLVDGDEAGKKYCKNLKDNGVDKSLIFNLKNGYTLEDYIDKKQLLKAINEQLEIHHDGRHEIQIDDLKYPNVMKSVKEWCEKNNIKEPSKVKIAETLVFFNEEIIDKTKAVDIKRLHKNITEILFR